MKNGALAYVEIDEASLVGRLVVNRPHVLNALDVATAQAIRLAADQLNQRQDLRCIEFSGAGRAFMAGGDLSAFADDFAKADNVVHALLDALEPVIATFQTHSAPVIASVHGAVAGAGLSLLAACDLAVAGASTRFLLAYNQIAAPPDCGGSYFLPRLLGERKAAELMYLGENWNAQDAQAAGLINKVVADEELISVTADMVAKIAAGPTLAFTQYKKLVRNGRDRSLDAQLAAEREAFCAATKTADFREGVSAFLARRAPAFLAR
ncbi:2-(1,2-epoxy-1,2-dihydrophenyl)acetyl-CoA isomerase PaaG [Spongiibacter taiwanensis]